MVFKRTVLIRWIQTPATLAPHGGMICLIDVMGVGVKEKKASLMTLVKSVQWL
jgi:hypothetical protein